MFYHLKDQPVLADMLAGGCVAAMVYVGVAFTTLAALILFI